MAAKICVFLGSNHGRKPEFQQAAVALGRVIAERGLGLVYGGGRVGLMGVLADAVLEHGGEVVGVIPGALHRKEVGHHGLHELHVVTSMHERKAMMAELSSAFVALPGGIGTLEEIFEALTWLQLGFHAKPCGVLNVAGYYDALLEFLDNAVSMGFLRAEHRASLLEADDPEALLDALQRFELKEVSKWGQGRPDEARGND